MENATPRQQKGISAGQIIALLVTFAVLVWFAIPSLTGIGCGGGRATIDAGNLRQLGVGLVGYLNEHEDDMFPLASGPSGQVINWPEALHKFVPDWKSFQSPYDTRKNSLRPPVPVSYAVNRNLFDTNTSTYTSPSELIVMASQKRGSMFSKAIFDGTSSSNPALIPGIGIGTHRHDQMINVLFADAHVGSMSIQAYADTRSTKGAARWNPVIKKAEPRP